MHHAFMGGKQIERLRIGNKGPVVVVEGIMDLLSIGLEDYGVATLGASYSVFLMAFLRRHFGEVLHLPDNDRAGVVSADKLESLCKSYDIKYRNINDDNWLYKGTKAGDPSDLSNYDLGLRKIDLIKKHLRSKCEKQNRKRKL